MPAIIVTLVFITIGFIIFLFFYVRKKRHTDFVIAHSQALQDLKRINADYKFYDTVDLTQSHTYDNENFYNNISCQDFLIYQLQFKRKEVLQQINKAKYNNRLYKEYYEKVSNIKCFECFDSDINKYNKQTLSKIEKKLFKQNLKHPDLEYFVNVVLYCSQINGRVYKRKTEGFPSDKVQSLINRLNNKTGSFYNDREIWDSICRVERGRVSNKMRFAIYKRDGYRCRNCGRTNRFDDLEIDHIKPIAKGGKSTFDNLQTLCKRCNKEKGDTYYE